MELNISGGKINAAARREGGSDEVCVVTKCVPQTLSHSSGFRVLMNQVVLPCVTFL